MLDQAEKINENAFRIIKQPLITPYGYRRKGRFSQYLEIKIIIEKYKPVPEAEMVFIIIFK